MRTKFWNISGAESYLGSHGWRRLGAFASGAFNADFFQRGTSVIVVAQPSNGRFKATPLGDGFDTAESSSSSSSSSTAVSETSSSSSTADSFTSSSSSSSTAGSETSSSSESSSS